MQTSQTNNMAGATLRQIVRHIDEISSLPDVTFHVLEVANDPDSGAADLKEVLEKDPALSARLLRYVNSSAYSLRNKISDLQQAITLLGVQEIRKLALTGSVSELFKAKGGIGPYRRSDLWRHMVAVGLCARLIGKRLKARDAEDLYLAGLLHDVGIILEDQHVHQPFCRIIQSLAPGKSLVRMEQEWLGFDHTVLGEKIAETWGFPELVRFAIRRHHASPGNGEPHAWELAAVRLANAVCTAKGISSVGVRMVELSKDNLETLSLTPKDLATLNRELDEEMKRHATLLQL